MGLHVVERGCCRQCCCAARKCDCEFEGRSGGAEGRGLTVDQKVAGVVSCSLTWIVCEEPVAGIVAADRFFQMQYGDYLS